MSISQRDLKRGSILKDIEFGSSIIIVFGFILIATYAIYCNLVITEYKHIFYYGYLNPQVAVPPGTFVDRRYSPFWIFLFIATLRLVCITFYLLLTDTTHYSWILFSIHNALCILFIIFGIFYILLLLFFGWNCNSSLFPGNPCNDPLYYCAAYGNVLDTICKTDSFTGYDSLKLIPNQAFTLDFWISIAFLIQDVLQSLFANMLRTNLRLKTLLL